MRQLESRKLKYVAGVAKNRKVACVLKLGEEEIEIRLDELAKSWHSEAFTAIQLLLETPRTVWVARVEVEFSSVEGTRTIAIVMNAASFPDAKEIDYLITNAAQETVTAAWVVTTYSQRNWVEVFYREAKRWLGLREYKVRSLKSLSRHVILVFCAYTFILWHQLTGGL